MTLDALINLVWRHFVVSLVGLAILIPTCAVWDAAGEPGKTATFDAIETGGDRFECWLFEVGITEGYSRAARCER